MRFVALPELTIVFAIALFIFGPRNLWRLRRPEHVWRRLSILVTLWLVIFMGFHFGVLNVREAGGGSSISSASRI